MTNEAINYSEESPSESSPKVHEVFAVNILGVTDVTRAILPHFRERKAGVVINRSLLSGLIALPPGTMYHATRFALEGFSESLSYELLVRNSVVKLIEPGLVKTNRASSWLAQLAPGGILDYEAYANALAKLYGSVIESELPEAATVAEQIFAAATDSTDRLRYSLTDGGEGFVRPRYALPEEEYIKMMRATQQPNARVFSSSAPLRLKPQGGTA